jgi:hypothetical protein
MHSYDYADWTLNLPKDPAPHVLSLSDGKRLPQTLQSFERQQRQLEKSSTQLYINSTLHCIILPTQRPTLLPMPLQT